MESKRVFSWLKWSRDAKGCISQIRSFSCQKELMENSVQYFANPWHVSAFEKNIGNLCTGSPNRPNRLPLSRIGNPLPSRKLTYPFAKALLKMIFLFPRWDEDYSSFGLGLPGNMYSSFVAMC